MSGVYTVVLKSQYETTVFATVIEMHGVSDNGVEFLRRLSKASKIGLLEHNNAPFIDVYDGPPVVIKDDNGNVIFTDYNEEKKITND